MSEPVIKVEGLGKKYIIGHQKQEKYTALRDVISNTVRSVLKPNSRVNNNQEEFWALKDLNFEINQGDRVGIIGRNGAGKSTLLKVLSRITEPTTGSIKIKGRVASLLEVGTGFHPELTGRENIFLNGAILGMSKVEIKKKFDEIVAFAEVEKFLDTPVKRYSSGMYVRLAFAVAAHLEPEILVVDEVLAVGDAQFQKKCLNKMEDVGKEGRTVLFVSHNLGAIKSLCTSSIVLSSGNLIYQGLVNKAISYYNDYREHYATNYYLNTVNKDTPYIKEVRVTQAGQENELLQMNLPIQIDCQFEDKGVKNLVITVVIRNSEGNWLVHSTDEFADSIYSDSCRKCIIPANTLAEGDYYMMLALGVRNHKVYEKLDDLIKFTVEFSGKMEEKTQGNSWKGYLAPGILQWN